MKDVPDAHLLELGKVNTRIRDHMAGEMSRRQITNSFISHVGGFILNAIEGFLHKRMA